MNTYSKITSTYYKECINNIQNYKRDIFNETIELDMRFKNILENLIATTPTGELRNTYTDLNILYNNILENQKILNAQL